MKNEALVTVCACCTNTSSLLLHRQHQRFVTLSPPGVRGVCRSRLPPNIRLTGLDMVSTGEMPVSQDI